MVVAISALALYLYGFNHFDPLFIVGSSVVFFILSALMVTSVQLGIFVDGKPIISISKIYKLMPILAFCILVLSFGFWSI